MQAENDDSSAFVSESEDEQEDPRDNPTTSWDLFQRAPCHDRTHGAYCQIVQHDQIYHDIVLLFASRFSFHLGNGYPVNIHNQKCPNQTVVLYCR